jgi:hypothetical protein
MNNYKRIYRFLFFLPLLTIFFIYMVLSLIINYILGLNYPIHYYGNKILNYFEEYKNEVQHFNVVIWSILILYIISKYIN